MLLERLRDGTACMVSRIKKSGIRQWIPVLLLIILVVYLFMGSACFWFFEHDKHEQSVRKWYMNLAVNRFNCYLERLAQMIFRKSDVHGQPV
ncbi:hypothetical protein NECAME_03945 [Necator americanus]|uniref:Uncharacterized protein n=1 Tax=Necator americanus TaxID=51031 RepID=W2T1H1_NECAM|nr:hypothetical protein NECAME_03945 [Necator americanus]ETN74812.1 hypothetical protein NECAME_03945 [Necator americanus]